MAKPMPHGAGSGQWPTVLLAPLILTLGNTVRRARVQKLSGCSTASAMADPNTRALTVARTVLET